MMNIEGTFKLRNFFFFFLVKQSSFKELKYTQSPQYTQIPAPKTQTKGISSGPYKP